MGWDGFLCFLGGSFGGGGGGGGGETNKHRFEASI